MASASCRPNSDRLLAEHPVVESVAAAADAVAEVELLKTALRAALQKRNDRAAIMRHHTTRASADIAIATGSDPAALLAAGVGVKKAKQPVGKPGAPTLMRVVSTESEGAVSLRWKRPVRRCVFLIQMTTAPAATRGWKQVAHQHPPILHRDRLEKRGQMLVPRGCQQRPRPGSVEPAGERAGEIILVTDLHR